MALAPVIVFGWIFDRSSRNVLYKFVRSGFSFSAPEADGWDEERANHQEIKGLSFVYIAFVASIALQSLMLGIGSDSTAMLVLWSIFLTSMLKGMPLTRKVDPAPYPPSS
jgi:hypothetical protein